MSPRPHAPRFPLYIVVTALLLVHLPRLHGHSFKRLRASQTHLSLDALIANIASNKTIQTSQRQDAPTGLTLDPCTLPEDCRPSSLGDRICVEFDDPQSIDCPNPAASCQCATIFDPSCNSTSNCEEGEICATRISDGFTFCASQIHVDQNPNDFRRNETVSGGVTLDPCQSRQDCRTDLICAEDESNSTTCPQGAECFCFPTGRAPRCAVEWECPLGETCAIVTKEDSNVTAADLANNTSLQGVCVSTQAVSGSENILDIFEVYNITIDPSGVANETERTGLRYELCERDSDCNSGSTCIADRLSQSTNCGPRGCRCFPDLDVICVEGGACEEGEDCAALNRDFGIGICISRAVLNSVIPALEPLKELDGDPFPPTGLTADRCLFNSDCQDPRICELDEEVSTPCQLWDACFCFFPLNISINCETSDDCVTGESCVDGIGSSPACVSETAVQGNPGFSVVSPKPSPTSTPRSTGSSNAQTTGTQPSGMAEATPEQSSGAGQTGEADGEESVCVDARIIGHLKPGELVFKENRWAKVLCDRWGSCATRGHIVMWEGRAMMMASYCGQVAEGCEERKMWVNSPRWRRGMRVAGRGGGLEFTTFAARWGSRWEESVLRAVVHAGL